MNKVKAVIERVDCDRLDGRGRLTLIAIGHYGRRVVGCCIQLFLFVMLTQLVVAESRVTILDRR